MRKPRIRSVIAGSLVAVAAFLLGGVAAMRINPGAYFVLADTYRYRNEERTRVDFLIEVVGPRLTGAPPLEEEAVNFTSSTLKDDPLWPRRKSVCTTRKSGSWRVTTCQYRP